MKKLKSVVMISLMLITALVVTGCGESGKPSAAVKGIFEGFIETDGEKMIELIDDPTYTPFYSFMDMPASFGNLIIDKLKETKYEILKETISEDEKTAKVEIKVTYSDIGTTLADAQTIIQVEESVGLLKEATFEESAAFKEKTFIEQLTKNVKVIDETLTLNMVKTDKGWKFKPMASDTDADPLYNIFTGNLIAYIEAMSEPAVVE